MLSVRNMKNTAGESEDTCSDGNGEIHIAAVEPVGCIGYYVCGESNIDIEENDANLRRANQDLHSPLRPLLRPASRPGVSLFRHFRSYLAEACAMRPPLRPAPRPGVSRFPSFRSYLADGGGASSRQSVEQAAWNICASWNIAVRTRPIRCARGRQVNV